MQSLVFLTYLFSKVIEEKPLGGLLDLVKEGLRDTPDDSRRAAMDFIGGGNIFYEIPE